MSNQTIHTALRTHLNDLPGGSDIAYENRPFTPTVGELWLRENFLPAETDAFTLSDGDSLDYSGVYQVTVFAPEGQSVATAEAKAEAIESHFARGTTIGSGRVLSVSRGPSGTSEGWFSIPITIRYRAFYDG